MTSEGYGDAFHNGFAYTVRFLRARGASHERAEEVAQAAWTKGWERLTQLRDECSVGCWVNTIALNELRRGIRRESLDAPLGESLGQIGVDCAAIDTAAILKRCHPRDQILFEHQLHGLTTEEIAASLGVTPTAIRVRFLRARRSARRNAEIGQAFRRNAEQRMAFRDSA